ncbi:THC0290_0291 family protein [Algibacter sp. L3A6]|jgi:hypothetical protein|uniref:THC0290_0291 family protein n=1 Tax=Algibacter sp. L3A6 TaxID=2686366 RepID=UPI00131B3180|nr:glutamate dehydrogenase [Algibacter sp. L3A6]
MLNLKRLACFICLFATYQTAFSQLGFSHEIGVIAGPVQFRADYGQRDNSSTNFENSGFGIGIVHYLNFAYRADCNCYTTESYFNDHFKLRNEISYNKSNLEHVGRWVDANKNSDDANRLRGHEGVAENFDIGTQIEFYPLSIRDFQSFSPRVAPFVSLGIHYTAFTPSVTTTYANPDPTAIGDVTDASNFYSLWDPGSVDATPGSTFSTVMSVGMRYKLDRVSDLMIDFRGQFYFSDWVDGLNHQLDYNKNNDWLMWFNVGYIYYLD